MLVSTLRRKVGFRNQEMTQGRPSSSEITPSVSSATTLQPEPLNYPPPLSLSPRTWLSAKEKEEEKAQLPPTSLSQSSYPALRYGKRRRKGSITPHLSLSVLVPGSPLWKKRRKGSITPHLSLSVLVPGSPQSVGMRTHYSSRCIYTSVFFYGY